MDADRLTAELKARAAAEGFDRVAVARADALDRDRAVLEDWLARHRHAQMHWMARDPARRADPRRLLPGCRSVVSLAMNYYRAETPPAGTAQVARYARGRDYHRVLGDKLKRLAAWLETHACAEPGVAARAFVDTGPLLERAWAERAGLGWIGKNANLLTRDLGSWLLLGDLVTTAELTPDPGPHAEFCGSCTACIDACPTDAIVADGVVDSNLCISYWTIEHRGPVPEPRRAGHGDWIFGCDVCQDVCPWNERFARPHAGDPFARRDDLQGLDPVEVLGLDEARFRARYSGTALMRAKWEGMRRNACIVLGNRGDPAACAALSRALDDADPVVRGHAAWALGRIADPAARPALERRRDLEPDAATRAEIDRALTHL